MLVQKQNLEATLKMIQNAKQALSMSEHIQRRLT